MSRVSDDSKKLRPADRLLKLLADQLAKEEELTKYEDATMQRIHIRACREFLQFIVKAYQRLVEHEKTDSKRYI